VRSELALKSRRVQKHTQTINGDASAACAIQRGVRSGLLGNIRNNRIRPQSISGTAKVSTIAPCPGDAPYLPTTKCCIRQH
jgi:hypothetical protein